MINKSELHCPACSADGVNWLISKSEIELDIEEAETKHPAVLNFGHLSEHAKYWFNITQIKCIKCGFTFWLQDETK